MGNAITFSSDDKRIGMYQEVVNVFQNSPIFGIGFDNYRLTSLYQTYSHSTYAEVLATTGLIGSIIYFIPYLIIFSNLSLVYYKNRTNKEGLLSLQYLLLLLVIIALGTGVIHFYGIRDTFAFSWMISFYYIEKKKLRNRRNIIASDKEL
ncbi:hypothetical protein AX762_11760 [Alkalibacterium sp. 20]|nr:hypothetical protein AX762_11760 [Alkalibacterium sp. 20]